jgi:PAS domain S-box-containing protein
VALHTVGDAVILNHLAELATLEINLDEPAKMRESSDAARTLGYAKSVSLNRLQLVLRTAGFTNIAVYTEGQLSHYVSASQAGMRIRKTIESPVWVQASADPNGDVPFHNWPAWSEAEPPAALSTPPAHLHAPTVLFNFRSPQDTSIEIAVPIQGFIEEVATDVVPSKTRFISELEIAGRTKNQQTGGPGRQPTIVAVVVFQKLIDHAVLEELATKTAKMPALFSPDGKHRQVLTENAASDLWNTDIAHAAMTGGIDQRTVRTQQGSFHRALLPWEFEGQPRLILGLASSRASTLQNIQQTVAAILTVAGLVLLLSVSLGTFWVNRVIDPIVALTVAAKQIGKRKQIDVESTASDKTSVEVLRRIAHEAPDEVGDLAEAFNGMIAELHQSFETLEQRVQDRTAELRQQTRYLRTLIDTLPLLVWLKDTKSEYLTANQVTADACGRSVQDIVGKSDLELWPREIAESYRADDAEVMASRQRKTVEEHLAGVQGTIWIETYKAPVLDEDGTVLGTVGAARDISERKAAEAAREAALAEAERLAQLRSEFLAQMSHELRTPLNAILGYAQILQRDAQLTARQARGLAIIQESGHHLLTLINDILDLSRIGASKLELYPVDVNLSAFLRTVCDIIRVKADEKSLLFTYEESADLPAAVRVDDKRLRQVLLNLLGNAIKFTDRGHVALRVIRAPVPMLGRDDPEADKIDTEQRVRLRFEIEDSGIGMTDEQVQRIFHPFEQVADVERRRGGAGLGLTISRQLVRLMGGDIHVRSEADKGSAFSFELNLPIATGQPETPSPQHLAVGYSGPRRKVLVADDAAQSRMMLMDFLTSLGFEAVDATNGEEAIEQAQRTKPDLIVMDIMMPLMDGLEATRQIRSMPELRHIPILIASASATSGDEFNSLAAGANAFVPKPIEEETLLDAIGQCLDVEWTYEDTDHELQSVKNSDAIMVPPPEEMEVLHELALAGNMRGIRERANHLKNSDARYGPFAQRLQHLAERYQSEAVLDLVERYRTDAVRNDQSTDSSPTRR